MAIAERELRARFGPDVQDHHTFVIAGDGCLQEGISHEAASLAGHLGLGHLVVVYDDNHVTIDGDTVLSSSDDAAARFRAYGWHVMDLGEIANDCDALEAAVREAMAVEDRPSFLRLRTHIGYPSPDHTDDHEAHGLAFDADDVRRTKAVMGIPDEPFWAPRRARRGLPGARRGAGDGGRDRRWEKRLAEWTGDRNAWDAAWAGDRRARLAGRACRRSRRAPSSPPARPSRRRWRASYDSVPGLVAGAADLTGNTGVKLDGAERQSPEHPGGRQLYFGIREHAMGASLVGMACHGGVIPVGGTFFVFSDYLKPSLRLAAMSAGASRLRLQPRLGRRRRGRPHAPARRAAGRAPGHPRPPGHPAGRRQRDRRGLAGRRRATTAPPP